MKFSHHFYVRAVRIAGCTQHLNATPAIIPESTAYTARNTCTQHGQLCQNPEHSAPARNTGQLCQSPQHTTPERNTRQLCQSPQHTTPERNTRQLCQSPQHTLHPAPSFGGPDHIKGQTSTQGSKRKDKHAQRPTRWLSTHLRRTTGSLGSSCRGR